MFGKIILAGGSGYLGSVLAEYFADKAREIVILSRRARGAEEISAMYSGTQALKDPG